MGILTLFQQLVFTFFSAYVTNVATLSRQNLGVISLKLTRAMRDTATVAQVVVSRYTAKTAYWVAGLKRRRKFFNYS